MAITLVGTATGTTTATPPAHQAGDLFLVFAYRDGNTTPPTLASGFTNVNNAGGNTNSFRVGRKFASSSSDTVGTWTNATSVILIVLRGVNTINPTGGVNTSNGSSTTITYNSVTLADSSGSSWVFAFGGHRSTNVAIETVPTGMTLATSVSDATDEAAAFYLESATSFTSRTASVGGTSSGWISSSVEVRAQPPTDVITAVTGLKAEPTVGSPALGQVHVLGAIGLQSTPSVGRPLIGQVHNLTALGVVAQPVLDRPALSAPGEAGQTTKPTGFMRNMGSMMNRGGRA